jgi:hypothetical protein
MTCLQAIITAQQLSTVSVPEQAVQYIPIPANAEPVQYANIMPAAAQSLASVRSSVIPKSRQSMRPVIEYVPLKEIQALSSRNNAIRRQQLAVGGRGVYRGQQLEDAPADPAPAADAAPAAAAAAEPVMPAPITPPTPQEIAMALQRIQVLVSLIN